MRRRFNIRRALDASEFYLIRRPHDAFSRWWGRIVMNENLQAKTLGFRRAFVHDLRQSESALPTLQNSQSAIRNPQLRVSADQVAQRAECAAEVALDVLAIAAARGDDAIGQSGERERLDPH